ncbi:unnamed protein product [Cylicocyclus nassatus]|uniref:SHSP domain-containing protein n=1 Tax=Cylicocyclus nassatus TaxID=53992 RepID=A0AA36GRT6_CYLNA|nr:unnamed protein product [Cylicocyclus nassatus]
MSMYFVPHHRPHRCCNHHYREPDFLDTFLNDLDQVELALIPLEAAMMEEEHQRKDEKKQESAGQGGQQKDAGHGGQHNQVQKQAGGRMSKVEDDNNKLAISLNVGKFKPEELKVDLDGRVLKVQGKQEVKDDNGYSLRTFVRQWKLPNNVDMDQIKSNITEDGRLTIEAPKITKPSTRSIEIGKASAAGKENQSAVQNESAKQSEQGHHEQEKKQ